MSHDNNSQKLPPYQQQQQGWCLVFDLWNVEKKKERFLNSLSLPPLPHQSATPGMMLGQCYVQQSLAHNQRQDDVQQEQHHAMQQNPMKQPQQTMVLRLCLCLFIVVFLLSCMSK
jgi:hypothetical protein